MFVTLSREGGSSTMLTSQAARRLLAPETDPVLVFAGLGIGNAVDVMLTDGSRGTMRMSDQSPDPDPHQPEFPIEALRPMEPSCLASFNAHCRVMLEFSVDIACEAIDEVHAEQLIRSVVRGERNPPPRFAVVFDADDQRDFLRRVERLVKTGQIAQAGVAEVVVTGFAEPQRQLEYRP